MPVSPTFLRSATPAMPPMTVRNTIGPISIFIAVRNVVPIGSIEVARSGRRQPSRTPITIAASTWTYSCRYHGFGTVRSSAGVGVCVIAASLIARDRARPVAR